jgi:RNA polymerase sigma-70 factor (ECF subfamily)
MYNTYVRYTTFAIGKEAFSSLPSREGAPQHYMITGDERQLVVRIQAGDRQAFEQLLDSYETRVYRLALRFTGCVPDAEDVTQEIFLAIYKGIGNFRGNSTLGTWIYRIAMNHCLEFRRKRRLEVLPYDEELTLASTDWRKDPVQSADRQELSAKVEAAINCLSPMHRDVIVLHELQGLTYQEVAATLNVPVGTVKSRLSNAFRRLRDLLGGYVYEGTTTT